MFNEGLFGRKVRGSVLRPLCFIVIGGCCKVTLVVTFGLLLKNFGEVAWTYEWYFVILSMQVELGGDTQTLPAVIKFV